jgi:hypothetical protein
MRRFHPLRLQYEMFSRVNPFVHPMVSYVRENRQPVSGDNAFWQAQERLSDWTKTSLDAYRDVRDRMIEASFHATYSSPLLQALVGLRASDASPRRGPGTLERGRKVAGRCRLRRLPAGARSGAGLLF